MSSAIVHLFQTATEARAAEFVIQMHPTLSAITENAILLTSSFFPFPLIFLLYIGCPTLPLASQDLPNKNQCNLNSSFRSYNVLSLCVYAYLKSPHPVSKNSDPSRSFNATQNAFNYRKKFIWRVKRAPLSILLTSANRKKSEGAKSGE
jgi:hypothetical protein